MMGWLWYALWLDLWARILRPAPERKADVVDLAAWRRDHPRDNGHNGHGGRAA